MGNVDREEFRNRQFPAVEVEPFQRPRFGDPVPPTRYRPDWAGVPVAAWRSSVTFVSSSVDAGALARRLGTRRALVVASGMRGLTRESLACNRATAPVDIDVRTGEVTLGGARLAVDPVAEVPLSRRYLLR